MKVASIIILRLRAEKRIDLLKICLQGVGTRAECAELVHSNWLRAEMSGADAEQHFEFSFTERADPFSTRRMPI